MSLCKAETQCGGGGGPWFPPPPHLPPTYHAENVAAFFKDPVG